MGLFKFLPNKIDCAVPEKNPYPPHRRSLEIPRGRGILIVKILEAKYEALLEFPGGMGGGGAKQKTFCGGSIGVFWNCTLNDLEENRCK